MSPHLTSEDLDGYADRYYLNEAIEDVDIEELAQTYSIPSILAATEGCPRLLEMGYGTGLIATKLLEAGRSLDVLEGSSRLIDFAGERHQGQPIEFVHSMFETFVPDEPYDAVLALHVLEHVDEPVVVARQIAGWLRSGGTIVAVTPNSRSLHRMLGVAMGLQEQLDDLSERDHLVGHQRVYDLDGLRADLQSAGFEVTGEFGYFLKPLSNRQMLDWPDEVLEGFNKLATQVPADLCANIGLVARKR